MKKIIWKVLVFLNKRKKYIYYNKFYFILVFCVYECDVYVCNVNVYYVCDVKYFFYFFRILDIFFIIGKNII